MKSAKDLFERAIHRNLERGYSTLYVAIDVHGTIIRPSKRTEVWKNECGYGYHEVVCGEHVENFTFYPDSVKALQILSDHPNIKIILWTSTQDVNALVGALERLSGVHVDYLNQNPDFQFNSYADFSKKFCFDVLLDDKAGFDPNTDWSEILKVDFSKLGGENNGEG